MELKDQILARMYVVITLMSLLPILVGLQVLRVTAIDGDDLRAFVDTQSTEYRDIPAIRGEIFDAADKPLVVNIRRVDIAVDPTVLGLTDESELFFDMLSDVSDVTAADARRQVRRGMAINDQHIMLARRVTLSRSQLEWMESINGVIPEPTTTRYYNHGSLGAHVLGYTGTDGGLDGLEVKHDSVLSGIPGRQLVNKDRRNRVKFRPGNESRLPVHGESLYLTIDMVLQSIVEEELARGLADSRANWASLVALDPKTGAVLAWANAPTFDLNNRGASPLSARRNHAIADKIEPGSVIKVVPAAAAIQEGVIAMSDSIDTGDGSRQEGRFKIEDTHPHGKIPFTEVIKVSSNVGTAIVSDSLTDIEMYKWVRQFGFNQQTGIELPGEASTDLTKPSRWNRTDRSAMSRGYAMFGTTLQIALAYGALANGGVLMKPYIVRERRDDDGYVTWQATPDSVRRVFDQATADSLMPAFESVVSEDGTGNQVMVDGLRIAGKTGTARKNDGNGYIPGAYRATFVGFWPVEDPQVVMAIVMDEPGTSMYGGSTAGPVFKRVTERWLARMPEAAAYVRYEDESSQHIVPIPVPDVQTQPLPLAQRSLRASGLRSGRGPADFHTQVLVQDVRPGTDMLQGVPVGLAVEPDTLRVTPDVTGRSSRDAMSWLTALGIEVEIEGHGTVQRQWPAAGEPLEARMKLKLN